jgi:catechol 2,3-dioxygenase-like lactoylglutathione lyase family enzyme
MRFLGLHHVQITVEPADVGLARDFYIGVLGMEEIPKPEALAVRGGLWVRIGAQELHVSPDPGIDRTATRAHPAFEVDDLEEVRRRLANAGLEPLESVPIPGIDRFECRDPFGNRLEFLRRL